jgi:uncharacterized protein YbjT (DUF2867 family)
MSGRVLVIGATGTVGGALVSELRRVGAEVRGATRDPAAAAARDLLPADAWVPFDLERPETFPGALAGVDRVFLVARPGDDAPERTALPLLAEMARQGVRHVVDLSALGAEQREEFGLRKVERALEASGMAWTHLRPNWFMQVFTGGPLHADLRRTGAFHLAAGDARVSYVDARDIAAVAAAALTRPAHEGHAYTLTGPAGLTGAEVAAALSAAAGRPLDYVALDEEVARQALTAALGARWAERLVGFYRLVRAGWCAPVSPAVEQVLGRPPVAFADFAREHAAAWR